MEYNVGDNETIDTNSSLEDYADFYTAEEFKVRNTMFSCL
jgi:hypothetical protein